MRLVSSSSNENSKFPKNLWFLVIIVIVVIVSIIIFASAGQNNNYNNEEITEIPVEETQGELFTLAGQQTPNDVTVEGTRDLGQDCDMYNKCKSCLVCWIEKSIGTYFGVDNFKTPVNKLQKKGICRLAFNGAGCVENNQIGMCYIHSATNRECVIRCTSRENCPTELSGQFCGSPVLNLRNRPIDVVVFRNYDFSCNTQGKCCVQIKSERRLEWCKESQKCIAMNTYNDKCVNKPIAKCW